MIKYAEASILDPSELSEVSDNKQASERFAALVTSIKQSFKIAEKEDHAAPFNSEDFLYFRTVIMHAAEHSNLCSKTGEVTGDGEFVPIKNAKGDDVVRWVSAKGTQPYANSNGDIFPEAELIKAAHTWIGKGLFTNHQSSDVEKLRGIIVDTFYDQGPKELWGLVAVDKKNFPTVAAQIKNGTIRNVSMGTHVKQSVCTACGNVALTESDYCSCIKTAKRSVRDGVYVGEINIGLSGIELSLVSIPADSKAQIREVYAAAQDSQDNEKYKYLLKIAGRAKEGMGASTEGDALAQERQEFLNKNIKGGIGLMNKTELDKRANDRKSILAYFQGTEEPNKGGVTYTPDSMAEGVRGKEKAKYDSEAKSQESEMGDESSAGDQQTRKGLQRAARREERDNYLKAYFQGTEEPGTGQTYAPESLQEEVKNWEEKKWVSEAGETMRHINETPKIKEMLQRASLTARFHKVNGVDGSLDKDASRWTVHALEGNKTASADNMVFSVTAGKAFGEDLNKLAMELKGDEYIANEKGITNWDYVSSKRYAHDLMTKIREDGLVKAAEMFRYADFEEEIGTGLDDGTDESLAVENPMESLEELGGVEGMDEDPKDVAVGHLMEAIEALELKDKMSDALTGAKAGDDSYETNLEEMHGDLEGAAGELEEAMDPMGVEPGATEEDLVGMASKVTPQMLKLAVNATEKLKASMYKAAVFLKENSSKVGTGVAAVGAPTPPTPPTPGQEDDEEEVDGEEETGMASQAMATGKEVKDIAAPANKGDASPMPTGKDVKDIADRLSPLISPSADTDLDTPADGHVESLDEKHQKHLDVALKAPTGKEGASFAELRKIAKRKSDREATANGLSKKSDEASRSYYNQMFPTSDAAEAVSTSVPMAVQDPEAIVTPAPVAEVPVDPVVSDLVQDFQAEAHADANEMYKASLKRAYQLAHDMADKGIITKSQIDDEIEDLVKLDKRAFDSLRRVVVSAAKNIEMHKTASFGVPIVGSKEGYVDDVISGSRSDTLTDRLNKIFK